MSWIVKDVECPEHGKREQIISQAESAPACDECGKPTKILPSFGVLAVIGADSFNAHYDIQLGRHFESQEHKAKVLQEMGRVQDSGTPSPRKSRKDRIIMSKEQFDRGVTRRQLLKSKTKPKSPEQ